MRHENCDLALVSLDGASNLRGSEDQSAGGVQHDVERHFGVRQLDRAQDFLGVVNVDVANQGKT